MDKYGSLERAEEIRKQKSNPDDWVVQQVGVGEFVLKKKLEPEHAEHAEESEKE